MNNIDELINKYLEGETTLSEEKVLRNYFSSNKVDPKWRKYQALFVFFKDAAEEKMPSSEARIIKISKRTNWYRIAAAIVLPLLCLAGYWSYQDYQRKQEVRLAYLQTEKALQLVGNHLNEGLENVGYLSAFEKAKNEILNIEEN